MRKHRFEAPVVGGGSLLVIFAVLCLTVFALLGLSAVQANQRLSDISAEAVADYYAADCEAEKIFAALRGGDLPAEVAVDGDIYSYTCPIRTSQELQVELRLADGDWEILRWQAVSNEQEHEEEFLSLWDGDIVFDE